MPITVDTSRPWHLEPMVWLLISGPALVVLACVFTSWLAHTTADDLVQDDYYKSGKGINRVLKRDEEAARQGLAASITATDHELRVRLVTLDGTMLPRELRLRFSHVTQSQRDRVVTLHETTPGTFVGQKPELDGVRYYATLEDTASAWRLTGRWEGGTRLLALKPHEPGEFSSP